MTDRNKLDYLIVNTGYTFHIIEKLGFDNLECIRENTLLSKNGKHRKHGHCAIYKASYKADDGINKIIPSKQLKDFFACDKDLSISYFDEFMNNCVYIYDTLGKGIYTPSNNDNVLEEINKIMSILDSKGIPKNGTICFRCNARSDIEYFKRLINELNYCDIQYYEGDQYVNTNKSIITIATFCCKDNKN